MERKALDAQITVEKGQFVATISTDSIDRDREVMIPEGMDATEWQKNPIIFWNHDHDRPIAKGIGKLKRADHHIISIAEFAKRPDGFEGEFFPDFARTLVEQGIVKGVSVGFEPIDSRKPTSDDRKKYGDMVERVTNRWRLFEWSLAPLQCNQDALIETVGKGLISVKQAKDVFGITVEQQAQDTRKRYVIVLPPTGSGKRSAPKKSTVDVIETLVRTDIAKRQGKLFLP